MSRKLFRLFFISAVFSIFMILTAYAEATLVTGSGVNMRSGPGTGYRIIDCLKKGTSVVIINNNYDGWCLVEYNGQTGYISKQFLGVTETENNSAAQSDPFFVIVSPQPDNSFCEIPPSPSFGTCDSPSEFGAMLIFDPRETSNLSNPSFQTTDAIISSQEKENDTVKTEEEYVSDLPTENADTDELYPIAGAIDLSKTDLSSFCGMEGYVTGNRVRFRSDPSLCGKVLSELFYGNAVTIIGTTGEWTAVVIDDQAGYIYSSYIQEGIYSVISDSAVSKKQEIGTNTKSMVDYPKDDNYSDTHDLSSESSASEEIPAGTSNGQLITVYACQFAGTKYSWGGADPISGFDCSGFVYYVYAQFGITLNRIAQDQALNGTHVAPSDLQPGDILCFYSSGNYIGHSGIYIGNGKFIHSANSNTGVIISDLAGNYSSKGFEARRIV